MPTKPVRGAERGVDMSSYASEWRSTYAAIIATLESLKRSEEISEEECRAMADIQEELREQLAADDGVLAQVHG